MATVDVVNAHPKKRVPVRRIKNLIHLILSGEKKSNKSWVSIVFLSNGRIRTINRKYLEHDFPTDCITFPLNEPGNRTVEGEIYVSLDMATVQARENEVSYDNEVLRLTAHGCLHLCGYDDFYESERKKMLSIGEHYLQKLK